MTGAPAGTEFELLDEDCALGLELGDDGPVVDNLVPYIDRRPIALQCLFDNLDRAVNTGAEAARTGKKDGQFRAAHGSGK